MFTVYTALSGWAQTTTPPFTFTPTANVLYVKKGATGNGSSWNNAVGELADALHWAHAHKADFSAAAPLQIWVAKGTYYPLYHPVTFAASTTDRDVTFFMVDHVNLYGNFAGNETSLDQRNFANTTHETILSGDLGLDEDVSNNAYHVVVAANENEVEFKLDGFTITQGNANGQNSLQINNRAVHRNYGGGIYAFSSSSIVLMNSRISNNKADNGGGISAFSFSSSFSIVLTNSRISNNKANRGGGIFSSSSTTSSITLTNSSLSDNKADRDGGGIYASSSFSPYSSSSITLTNSRINGNYANASGGGIYAFSNTSSSTLTLLNATFVGNKGPNSIYYNSGGNNTLKVHNSIIFDNQATDGTPLRGTDWLGGKNPSNIPTGNKLEYQYSLVQGHTATGNSNITDTNQAVTDLFVDPTQGDYRLKSTSPLINQGNNALYRDANPTLTTDQDLAGNPRLFDNRIDIGAYEYQSFSFSPTANVLYVKKGATGNGSSWNNAVGELADALHWAHAHKADFSAAAPLQIWVAKGIYYPLYHPVTFAASTTDRDVTFFMVDHVDVYGGFAGNETSLDERNLDTTDNETILSGDLGQDDDVSNNAYHVVVAASANEVELKLNGFTITQGNANGSGLFRINNSVVYRDYGGGIFSSSSSSSSSTSSIVLTNSTISGNHADTRGGGISFSSSYYSITLTNSTISNNKAANGGGIYAFSSSSSSSSSSSIVLTNSMISNNKADRDGGGIYSSSSYYSITLANSTISNNEAVKGGGIYAFSTSTTSSSITLTNSSLSDNSGVVGSGLYFSPGSSSTLTLLNATLVGNRGPNSIYYNWGSANTLKVHNSIIFDNQATDGALLRGTSWLGGGNQNNIPTGNRLEYQYSLVQGYTTAENGNIADTGQAVADLFVDPTQGDYRLKSTSPLINQGDNELYRGANLNLTTDQDLAGYPRLIDYRVDIGAYENQSFSFSPTANVLYVKKGATGNGSSWNNAVGELADALYWAQEHKADFSAAAPLQIWVAKGTYYPSYHPVTFAVSATDRDVTFLMVDHVDLYGGFAGDETSLDQRNLTNTTHATILSGDLGQDDDIANNAYHVVVAASENNTKLKLDGFTITRGNANGLGLLSINDSIDYRVDGGGIYASSSIALTNSTISNNEAAKGGGIYYTPSSSSSSSIALTNSTISNNEAAKGGGIYVLSNSLAITLTNSNISSNHAGDKGGGICIVSSSSSIALTNSRISGNHADGKGSGIYLNAVDTSTLTLLNATFIGNKGPYSIYYNGGGNNTLKVHNSIIFGNQATDGTPFRGTDWLVGTNQNNIPTGNKLEYKHSLVQGHTIAGNGNIMDTGQAITDLFVDPAQGDYRLNPTSPLINQGDNALYRDANPTLTTDQDLAGNPRLVGENIDIGAYESQCTITATVLPHSVLCFGEATGSATVTVTGGTAPYTYAWNQGVASTTNEATNLVAGTYTVTITDDKGCEIAQTFTISQPTALVVTPSQTNVICYGEANGSAKVEVTGGTAPYTYTWDNGVTSTTNEATNLVAGTYTVTITDDKGCEIAHAFTISQPTALEATPSQTNVICYGEANGSAKVEVTGGTAPYTYAWNQGIASTTNEATGLTVGTYTVTITDDKGCEIAHAFTISQPTALVVQPAQTNVICYGEANGSAKVEVTGGTAPYTYAWDQGVASTTNEATNLVSGTYTVTITDDKGCEIAHAFTITQPTALVVTPSQTNVICYGEANGSAKVEVTGGTAPYTYAWNQGVASTTNEATNLVAGTYTVTITDDKGCEITQPFTITQPTALVVTPSQTNVICYGEANGSAKVEVTGGTAPYTYAWNQGVASTTNEATGLVKGTYTVTITDGHGCTTTKDFTITQPTALVVTPSQTNVVCYGEANGSAKVEVTGGTAPYTYAWNQGVASTTNEATGLVKGTYTVTITDGHGCTTTKDFTITQPAKVLLPQVDTPVVYTYGDTALPLTATTQGGNTLLWYAAATGGQGMTTAPTPTTTAIGTQTYWVSQITTAGCESDRQRIDVQINKATLEVVVHQGQRKMYGSADGVFTYRVTGFKAGDNHSLLAGALARQAGESVGLYAITQGTLAAGINYDIHFVSADYEITAAPLTIVPDAEQTKVYGSANPTYRYTISGLTRGDTPAVVTGVLSRQGGEHVGRYGYQMGTLTSTANYTLTLAPAHFTITPASVEVVVHAGQRKAYGTADPVLSYAATGLVNGDRAIAVFSGRLERVAGEEVGVYAITQGTLQANANYQLTRFTGSDFEITPAKITGLQLRNKTFAYDGTSKSLAIEGDIQAGATVRYTGNHQVNVGIYSVTATVDYGSNYEVLTLSATLQITQAEQAIHFDLASPLVLEDTASFALNAIASSGLAVTYTYQYIEHEPVTISAAGQVQVLTPGVVEITAHQSGNGNYRAAPSITRTLLVQSKDSSIWLLEVDGARYEKPSRNTLVVIGCDGAKSDVVEIKITTQLGAKVLPSNVIVLPTPDYGRYEQDIEVISADGKHRQTYKVIVEKRLPWEGILMQKYDNVVFVNNNPQTNGGYKFSRYEWYKNGQKIADAQAFSAGPTLEDKLDPQAEYYAVLYTANGKVLTTCPMGIQLKSKKTLRVYPNPVQKTQSLYVQFEEAVEEFKTTEYAVYNTVGQFIMKGNLKEPLSVLDLPLNLTVGSYVLVLKIEGKHQSVRFVVKE
ncbi:MBG domain-containing protein [Myroides fluvii]|uniref:MBG domain-containing protein n=1 Tax=Myroides fluvii TaxID=2572594 RepID=UPI00131B3EEA|nr:MBG domain-containing protein [Myroides fluvii]